MLRCIFYTILLCFCISPIYTQDTFINSYSVSESFSDRGWDLYTFEDGLIMATGSLCYDDSLGIYPCFSVIRMDINGNEIWKTHFGYPNRIRSGSLNCLIQLSDGNFLVVGDKKVSPNNFEVFAIKLDDAGQIIWEKYYDGYQLQFARDVIELPNGEMVIKADGNPPSTNSQGENSFLKIDAQGEVLVQKEFNDTFSISQKGNLELLSTGEYLMTYEAQSIGTNSPTVAVTKLDADANIIWTNKIYDDPHPPQPDARFQARELQDGNYVILTSRDYVEGFLPVALGLVFMDTSGIILHEELLYTGSTSGYLSDMEITAGGDIIVSGSLFVEGIGAASGDWIPWLTKYTPTYEKLWERFFISDNYEFNDNLDINDLEIMADGRIALGMTIEPIDPFDNHNGIPALMVLDSTGCYIENCTEDIQLIITDVEDIISNSEDIIISPNPTSGIFRIEIPSDIQYNSLSFYDISGRMLLTQNIQSDIVEQDISHFMNGIYFMTLEDEYGQIISRKKIVVSK